MNVLQTTQPAILLGRVLDSKRATVPLMQMTAFKPPFDPVCHSTPVARDLPENEGISSDILYNLFKKIGEDKILNMHNVAVFRHGKLLCKAQFGSQRENMWKHTFSACKSVTSLAIGMLVDDGLLSLDEKLVSIFPNEFNPLGRIKLAELTVEDLLTMRSTIRFAEADSMTSTEWTKDFFVAPLKGATGDTFNYNSLNTYILSVIVNKKTAKSLSEFLDERLFAPLGIVDYYWERSPENIEKGGWGLYIRPDDFAKIGQLVLDKGLYNGKQLISSDYINNATSSHVDIQNESKSFDYGYQMWIGKDSDTFLFNGMLGQNIIGFKRNGILVVSNAGNGELFQQSSYFQYITEAFDRDFPDKCRKNSMARRRLEKYIASLSLYSGRNISRQKNKHDLKIFEEFVGDYTVKRGDTASVGIMPLVLQVIQNEYTKGFDSLSLSQKEDVLFLSYKEKDEKRVIPFSFEKPMVSSFYFGKNHYDIAAFAKMKKDEDDRRVLVLKLDFLETPCTRILKFTMTQKGILLRHEELPGEEFIHDTVSDLLTELANKPIISGVLDRFGEDYVEMKLKKSFAPELLLKKEE